MQLLASKLDFFYFRTKYEVFGERPCSRCPKCNGGEGTNGANAPQQEEANSSGVHGGAGLLEGH